MDSHINLFWSKRSVCLFLGTWLHFASIPIRQCDNNSTWVGSWRLLAGIVITTVLYNFADLMITWASKYRYKQILHDCIYFDNVRLKNDTRRDSHAFLFCYGFFLQSIFLFWALLRLYPNACVEFTLYHQMICDWFAAISNKIYCKISLPHCADFDLLSTQG